MDFDKSIDAAAKWLLKGKQGDILQLATFCKPTPYSVDTRVS